VSVVGLVPKLARPHFVDRGGETTEDAQPESVDIVLVLCSPIEPSTIIRFLFCVYPIVLEALDVRRTRGLSFVKRSSNVQLKEKTTTFTAGAHPPQQSQHQHQQQQLVVDCQVLAVIGLSS
jgi:hypothetical protein